MIGTGGLPEQQFSTLIPWMMEKYGKRVDTIAADYNFGQISAEWTRKLVTDNGGEIVGEELIPLGVSQFGQTIQNIQNAKPDWLMSLVVGNSQSSFYERAPAAGLIIPMGSSITIGLGFEHKRFKPPAMQNMHVAMNWFEEHDTAEVKEFVARWRAKFPTRPTSTTWARELEAIREQIVTGQACIEAPEGEICIDPKSQHVTNRMTQISVDETHEVTQLGPDRALLAGRDRAATSPSTTPKTSTRRAICPSSRVGWLTASARQPPCRSARMRVLRRINQELGTTILFVEQNLDMIMALTRRCYVMDKGRIVAELPSTELGDPETVNRHLQI